MPPSAEWDPLGTAGDAFYCRTQLYSLGWQFPGSDLSDYILAGALNGGPVALTRDESKPVLLSAHDGVGDGNGAVPTASSKAKRVSVYSSAGILLQSITWDHTARIAKIGWTANESLVILAKDGAYRLYPMSSSGNIGSAIASNYIKSPSSTDYSQHSLAHDVQDATILDARIYENGMVILLSTYQFIHVKGWPEPDILSENTISASFIASQSNRSYLQHHATSGADDFGDGARASGRYGKGRVERFAETNWEHTPSSWCILTPEQSTSRQTEVLASYNETLISIDQLDVQDQHFSRGPFTHIVPSPSGRFIAFVTRANKVYVVSANYNETLSEYDLSSEVQTNGPPKRALWCGNNSVVLAWDANILMVGPYGQTLRYDYLDPIHLVGEIDGARIISLDKCELLHKVSPSTVAVFSPGSVHPAAILYEAYQEFTSKNAHAHDSISNIRVDLVEAVDTCIDAASKEYATNWQKELLKTASFGKTFLDLYNPAELVNVSSILRVLNAVRYYEVGIPITYEQYQSRAPTNLISRLTLRNRHLLALRIASYLKLSSAPILRHWAQLKVHQSKNEQEEAIATCLAIVKRFKEETEKDSIGASDVSCADVAKTAWEEGKLVLATKLLDYEPRASKQVHLLLSMKEDNLALVKAERSGDSDLILSVLLALRRQHAVGSFFRFLDGKDVAIAILTNYGKANDRELIRDYWYQDDRRTESACFDLEEAASIGAEKREKNEQMTAEQFSERMEKIRRAQKTFSEDKERSFEAKMCEDQLKLLATQQSLQTEGGDAFNVPVVGISLNETVRQCLVHGMGKRAEKLRTDFKIPDKRWWYLKLKSLTETRDWEQLEVFAKSKKSPIGYEPFVEHLLATGNQRQAIKYIPRCESRNRADMYVKAGEWIKAAEDCRDRADRGKLNDIIARCANSAIVAQLQAILEDTRSF